MTKHGVRLEITTAVDDDFVRSLTRITASVDEHQVVWKLPNRLAARPEVIVAACEEIVEELKFYVERIVPIQNKRRSA